MMRVKNWTDKLDEILHQNRNTPFAWGSFDCILFAADVVKAITGKDYAERFRGRYSTAVGAARVLKNEGYATVLEAVTAQLGEPTNKNFLCRGDVAVFDNGNGLTAGICVADGVIAPAKITGFEKVPMACVLEGWSV